MSSNHPIKFITIRSQEVPEKAKFRKSISRKNVCVSSEITFFFFLSWSNIALE